MRRISTLVTTVALALSGLVVIPANADGENTVVVDCVTVGSVTGSGTFTITDNAVAEDDDCTGGAEIPAGVTSIGEHAFQNSDGLTTVTIPASVTSIGASAFEGTGALANVNFAASAKLTSIGEAAFRDASAITTIAIPASVTSIGASAFYGASHLASFTVGAGNTAFAVVGTALYSADKKSLVAYPAGNSASSFAVPAIVTSIRSDAFGGAAALQGFSVAAGNTSFSEVSKVLFSADKKALVASAIGNTQSTLTIPATVTSIGDFALEHSALTSITIPASVTSIGDFAFRGSSSLKTVTFDGDSQLATIGESAFADANKLAAIAIPASVTSIGDSAFASTDSLKTVTFDADSLLATIGDRVWSDAPLLKSITIPASVTSIGPDPFYNSDGLTTISFLGAIDEGSEDKGSVTLPNFEGSDYTFDGWYSDAKFKTKVSDGQDAYSVSEPVKLFAKLLMQAEATTKPSVAGKAISSPKGTNKLTGNKGVWTGFPTPKITYQWYSCTVAVAAPIQAAPKKCSAIKGATTTTLAVTATYKSKFLALMVTGQSAGTPATKWLTKSTPKVK